MSEGFVMNVDVAYLFYRTCKVYKIEDAKERVALLRKIVSRKKASYLPRPEEFIQGKHILRIKGVKRDKND